MSNPFENNVVTAGFTIYLIFHKEVANIGWGRRYQEQSWRDGVCVPSLSFLEKTREGTMT